MGAQILGCGGTTLALRSRGVLIAALLSLIVPGCGPSPPAEYARGDRAECATPAAHDERADTVLGRARLVLAAAAQGDSAGLARLVTNDTVLRKVLNRERPIYRAASSHARDLCLVTASSHRVEVDLRFPFARGGARRRTEHYQMVFVRGGDGWLMDNDILWSRL